MKNFIKKEITINVQTQSCPKILVKIYNTQDDNVIASINGVFLRSLYDNVETAQNISFEIITRQFGEILSKQ
jgi:hypothetical protein